jgi:hypothetical protein
MSILRKFGYFAASTVALWAMAGATAADELDQSYNGFTTTLGLIGLGGAQELHRAQTFNVGLTGTLTRIETPVTQGGTSFPLIAEIRTTTAGVPDAPNGGANVLGTVVIPASSIPVYIPPIPPEPIAPQAFVEIDFSSQAIHVTAGQSLALVLRTDDPSNFAYQWDMVNLGEYAGGGAFLSLDGVWQAENPSVDHRFRTFVQIPEPSASLLTLAFALIGVIQRRR